MTTRGAYIRVAAGLLIIAMLYVGPFAVGAMTAGERLAPSLARTGEAADIAISLDFIPGPSELEFLQTFGRYGGSGGNLNNVILLNVSPEKQQELSRIYWIGTIQPERGCPS